MRATLSGRKRKAIVAQVALHHRMVELRLKAFDGNQDGTLDLEDLHALMHELNDGQPVSDWAVDFVLATADCSEDSIRKEDVLPALARWRVLLRQQDLI
eukprot:SAG11_NODE_27913_length_327_cov_0.907895_1_plen_99_part_00